MPTDVVMPQMGESIFEGTITKWLKQTGDTVEKDEPLFEISTDKVDAEIPSPVAGVLAEIREQEGATVQINMVVAVISDSMAEAAAPSATRTVAAVVANEPVAEATSGHQAQELAQIEEPGEPFAPRRWCARSPKSKA